MSSALLARTGRHRQLYDNQFRLVAGCIPYRLKQNVGGDLTNRLEVLMISTPKRQDLVFPKGGWENDETVGEAACREALEEAGVRGKIIEKLGVWEFRSKSRQNSCSSEGSCKGHMFALEVTEELESWPEQASHKRRWVTVKDAWELCRYEWMREALKECINVLSEALKECINVLSEKPAFPVPELSETSFVNCNFTNSIKPSFARLLGDASVLKPSETERLDSAINAFC